MSKGGGSSAPQETTSTVTQTNLPDYAEPYFTRLLQRSEAESLQPYRTYDGQRLAEQSDAAQTALARQTALGLSTGPQELNQAGDIARDIGYGQPGAGGSLAAFDPSRVTSQYSPTGFDANYQTGDFSNTYQPTNFDRGYEATQFQSSYDPSQFDSGYQAQDYQTQQFDADVAQRYMNPFQSLVGDIEKREAKRQSQIQAEGIGDQATMSGGLGGYREAIMQSERERNLGQQLGDIEAKSQRDAFTQAQQQFERDRTAGFRGDEFAERQRQQQAQFGLTAQEMQDRAAQFGSTQDLTAQEMSDRARQFGSQQGMTAQQLSDASRQFGSSQDFASQQALDASRQFGSQQSLAAQRAADASQQFGSQQGLAAQQADIDAQIRARQLGLAGLGADQQTQAQRLQAAQQLSNIAPMQQQMAFDRLGQAQQAQEVGRNFEQASMDMGYQDYLNQLAYPRQQLGFQSQILQGLPVTPGTQVSQYQPGASNTSQLLGLGLGGLGLYKALGKG